MGLFNAGLKGVFAIEKHPDAFRTLKYNLIDTHSHFTWPDWLAIQNWDINEMLQAKSDKLYGLRGHIDLIVGGPPCQGFSVAGQRRASDKRNNLIHSYLRFVEIVQPRAIVFENVKGFTLRFSNSKKHNKIAFSEIVLEKLTNLGYIDARGEMVNFADYGVPQRRNRFIAVATRENLANKIFANLKANRQDFLASKELQSHNTVYEALSDLERVHGEAPCPDSPSYMSGITSSSKTALQTYLRLSSKGKYIPDSHRYVNHRVETQNIFQCLLANAPRDETIKGKNENSCGIKKRSVVVLDPDKSAQTLTTIPDDYIHYSEPRVMTAREYARLQTFPDWFEFKGPYTAGGKNRVKQTPRYTQIGNAIPPLFAEQLGLAIKTALQGK